MIEYILTATVLGAATSTLATYYLNKRRTTDIFTIKSDGKPITIASDGSKDNFPTKLEKLKPDYTPPASEPIYGQIAPIDMSRVTGIGLEGSSDVDVDSNRICVDGNATCNVLGQTLWIKSVSVIHTSFSSNSGKVLREKHTTKEIPFTNFDAKVLDRVSIQGSGTIVLHDVTVASNFDALVNGSGDIILRDIKSSKLNLQVKGSGDINVEGNVTADYFDARVQGSGDITINSINPINFLNKSIQGSGDIRIRSHYSSQPEMFI